MIHASMLAMSSGEGAGQGAGFIQIGMMVMIFVVFWFMIIRPQKKQQDQRKKMIEAMKRGDKIVTNGGLFATVRDVKGDRIVATIAEGVKVEISKNAVGGVLNEEEAEG